MRAIEGVGLFVTVSQVKWEKVKGILQSVADSFTDPKILPQMELKDLEKKVGFLVHLAMTYPLMFPFLKGFYLTMNSWRNQRDQSGWKMSRRAYEAFLAESSSPGQSYRNHFSEKEDEDAPEFVTAVPLLREHIKALLELF